MKLKLARIFWFTNDHIGVRSTMFWSYSHFFGKMVLATKMHEKKKRFQPYAGIEPGSLDLNAIALTIRLY